LLDAGGSHTVDTGRAAVDDPTSQQFAAGACSSVEQLVHHLAVFEHQLRQREKATVRHQASVRRKH